MFFYSAAISATSSGLKSPKGRMSRPSVSCGRAASRALSSAISAGQRTCTPSAPVSTRRGGRWQCTGCPAGVSRRQQGGEAQVGRGSGLFSQLAGQFAGIQGDALDAQSLGGFLWRHPQRGHRCTDAPQRPSPQSPAAVKCGQAALQPVPPHRPTSTLSCCS